MPTLLLRSLFRTSLSWCAASLPHTSSVRQFWVRGATVFSVRQLTWRVTARVTEAVFPHFPVTVVPWAPAIALCILCALSCNYHLLISLQRTFAGFSNVTSLPATYHVYLLRFCSQDDPRALRYSKDTRISSWAEQVKSRYSFILGCRNSVCSLTTRNRVSLNS